MSALTVVFLWDVRLELRNYFKEKLQNVSPLHLIFPNKEQAKNKDFPNLAQAHILVGWRVSDEMLQDAQHLRLIINPGIGVEQHAKIKNILQERNIVLTNTHGNAYFTAQHAVALLLGLCNQILPHHHFMQSGQWRTGDKEAKSLPLCYRKVGLLGYGAINRCVHRMLKGFDCEFYLLKRAWKEEEKTKHLDQNIFDSSQLHDFLKRIDTLMVALPRTPKTENLLGKKELEILGKDGLVVNVGRGAVINEEALYEALKSKTIKAAAIDVWYHYRPDADEEGKKYPYHFPFHELDNVILSPHRGASPLDDLERWNDVVENIKRVANGEDGFLNVVDLEEGY